MRSRREADRPQPTRRRQTNHQRIWHLAVLIALFLAAISFNPPTLHAQPQAGTALRFDGTDDYVSVTHNAALNPFPMTITAWVRTARTTNLYEGIVSKYLPGSGNGYSLHLFNGRLYAWYFRDASNRVYVSDPGLDGGVIADGQWHHVAFVVTPSGGSLYVDGNLRGSLGWTGTAGAPTSSTVNLLIGRYSLSAPLTNSFAGDIDEVTLWNRGLAATELNYLKHRRHAGNEDGLLGYWRFNEGSGTTANNSATNAFHGTTFNGPAWTPSHAAIALNPVATNALRFNGSSGYVQVSHNTNLNAYPLTASAWFRTTNSANVVQGIISKYPDGSGNGWSLMVVNGRLRGFYYRTLADRAIDVTSAAIVSDGGWHHAAMVVDASGGKLFLDGVQVGAETWPAMGTPGPPTNTEPLLIGRYFNYAQHFHGALDELAVWNRALSTNEVQNLKNFRLAGNESGLIACWHLDEDSGTSAFDATGNGYTGTLINSPVRVGSTAYLGDGSVHLIASPGIPTLARAFAINTAPGRETFPVTARSTVRRFHDFGPTPATLAVTNRLSADLRVSGSGTPIDIVPAVSTAAQTMNSYNASTAQPAGLPSVFIQTPTLDVTPANGVQLDSVNNLHEIVVTLQHSEGGGSLTTDSEDIMPPTRLLHFNGTLMFGNIPTVITNVVNTPPSGTGFPPTHRQTQLQLAANGAYLSGAPDIRFGGGSAFNVNLGVNGVATNVNGTFNPVSNTQFLEANGIRYRVPNLTLNASGAVAGNLQAWFPAGFGMQTQTNNRVLSPYVTRVGIALGADLRPTVSPVVFSAASQFAARLWFAEETKPVFIGSDHIEWRVPEGEFHIAEATDLYFVREWEDNKLAAIRTNLVNQNAADRISNDGYYHGASRVPGAPIYIRPDTNGAALMTFQAQLAGSEYRPHFPYLTRTNGGHVPVTGGFLAVSNDLVDIGASYLNLSNTIPVPYARDCPPEGACGTFAVIGHGIFQFTPVSNQLRFTRDGGFLSYGSVPPTNLVWSYIGGANFAQRTSDVQDGAYHVAGTFLRGDQTAFAEWRRPAALLHSGHGDDSNPEYIERPGTAAYRDGFANYPGLNFRAPAQGRSIIAGQDTGLYPLTPRAKYYVRHGGVSGIHEAASFPGNLSLYGYPFTFAAYRLSFLDSANHESRTDGAVVLPIPAGFNVEFERMKFLCRGSLDTARLPSTTGIKHMVYWNTDIKPLSLQFRPRANNACSLTERYLVLGVETSLPFIPQAFHAALAFKPNGNLTTRATGVEGVDSRFPVPAQLQLQGPNNSRYPLTTAGYGYFNNWETPGRPANGFYNLVGRVRVPFFRDTKVHLHVTPTSPSASQIAIMGGWPSEEGAGQNRGWTVGNQHYFNTGGFDANHNGWPSGIGLTQYRNSPTEDFRPRAQRNWINVALFDYPLTWNSVLREFSGFADAPVVLPVIDVNSRLKQLTPGKVDFDFSQDINVQLPRLKVLDFANQAVNEINAPIHSVSNAIRQQLTAAVNTAGLTSGFLSLQRVLRENADDFFRPVIQPVLDPVTTNVCHALSNALAVSRANLLNTTAGIISASSNGLQSAIQNINGAAAQPNTVFGELNKTLTDIDDTLGLFIRVLEKDGSGNRHVVRAIIQKITQDQGPAIGFAANLGDQLVNGLLADIEPTLAKIESELRQLRSQFNGLRSQITSLTGDFTAALNAAANNGTALQNFLQLSSQSVSNLLASSVGPAGDFFTADPARARARVREELMLAFLGSQLPSNYQTTFRQFFSDRNFLLDQLMNVLFDQINRSIRNALSSQIAGAQDGVFQKMKGAGQLSESLLSAKIRGAPTFQGDSLRAIHLDSEIKMNLPDEMKFSAYMDIRELRSETSPISCIPAGGPSVEVTLGARDVPLSWAGVSSTDPLLLSLSARWTLQNTAVLGIGGSLGINGKAGFKGASVNNIGASLAIGQFENYFAAKAGATVVILGVPVNFDAGVFAGKACSLDPLLFVDPEAAQVLSSPSGFSGVYLKYGGGLSLSEILFGSSSCVLDIRANTTTAIFYQGGPRFGTIGGRWKTGVDIDLFCVLSGHADWALFAALDTAGQLTFGGRANVCGKIGACPFCVEGCRGVTIKGVLTDGGVDYFVDY